MEDGERRSQPYSVEYDWFSSDLTQNNRVQLCPNVPSGFNYSESLVVPCSPSESYYPPSARRLIQSVYNRTFSDIMQHVLQMYEPLFSMGKYVVMYSYCFVVNGIVELVLKVVYSGALINKHRYWPKVFRGISSPGILWTRRWGVYTYWRLP